jgi:hypothetical protein
MTNEIDVQKLLEALNISADSAADSIGRMRGETDLATESFQDSVKIQRDVEKEFDKLGLVLKETTGVEKELYTTRKKSEEQLKKRQKLDEETNKIMAEAIPGWKKLSEAQQKEEKARLASANLLESQLASMNRVIDENNKLVDLTVRMNKADLLRLNMVQREEAAIKKHEQAIVGSANSLMDLPKKLGVMAVKFAMDRLIGSIDAAYRGLIAYEDALLAGANDEVTMGIARREQMQAEADAHGNLGESLKSLGGEMVILGAAAFATSIAVGAAGGAAALLEIALAALSGPIGWIVGAVVAAAGAFIWFKGREQEQVKKSIEYQKKRDEDLGKQNKALYEGYEKLSDSALVGSRGLQGMFDDLQKVGFTVSQFEKLNKVLQANQKDMKLFGAGLVDGAKQFTENAGNLINSELGGQLRAMGINQEQQMEHMAQFMSQQSKLGAKASGDQAKAAANYVLELDKMAVLTGASRKEQEDARKAILSMNQLRAAMLEAEEAGDTDKLAELTRAFETSSALMAAGLKAEGSALAKLSAAGGGPVDAETARIYQAMSGAGGTLEMIKSGQGSNVDRTQAAVSGLMKQNKQYLGTTKLTGGVAGQTMGEGDLGTLIDLSKSQDKIKTAAAQGSMTPEEYAASQRKPAADAEAATKARIAQQETMLKTDKGLREGTLKAPGVDDAANIVSGFAEGVKSFIKGVDEWVGNVADSMFGKGWWAKYGPGGEQDQENWRITKELFNNMWDSAGKEFAPWWDKYGIGGEQDQKNWEITKKAFDDMWTNTKSMTSEIGATFSKIGKDFGKSLEDVVNGMITAIKNLIKMIPGVGETIDKAKEVGGKAVDTVKSAASSVAGAASSAWGGVTSAFSGGGGGGGGKTASAGGGRGGGASPAASAGGGRGGGAPAAAPAGGGGGGGAPAAAPAGGGGGGGAPSGGGGGKGSSSEAVPSASPGAMGTETVQAATPAKPAAASGDSLVQMGNEVRIGDKIKKGGTVSWRTNNPGNNSYSDLAKKYGAIGTWKKLDGDAQQRSTGIAIMPSLEAGDNLKMAQWRRPMYIGLDIDHGVSQWTNGNKDKNLGTTYAKDIAKAAGVGVDTIIGDLTDTQLKAMVTKQRVWEGFKEGQVVSASLEGIAKGPESGYSAQLHGTELIKRLTPNSILDQLANTPAPTVGQTKSDGTVDVLAEIHQMMEDKFNTMISALRDGNDLTDKILKYSMV